MGGAAITGALVRFGTGGTAIAAELLPRVTFSIAAAGIAMAAELLPRIGLASTGGSTMAAELLLGGGLGGLGLRGCLVVLARGEIEVVEGRQRLVDVGQLLRERLRLFEERLGRDGEVFGLVRDRVIVEERALAFGRAGFVREEGGPE